MTRRLTKPGFTLVELMISIALVVVLMLGITKVFSLTSQTAGATNQMSSSMRNARAAQAEMTQDFASASRWIAVHDHSIRSRSQRFGTRRTDAIAITTPPRRLQTNVTDAHSRSEWQQYRRRVRRSTAKKFRRQLTTIATIASIRSHSLPAIDSSGRQGALARWSRMARWSRK